MVVGRSSATHTLCRSFSSILTLRQTPAVALRNVESPGLHPDNGFSSARPEAHGGQVGSQIRSDSLKWYYRSPASTEGQVSPQSSIDARHNLSSSWPESLCKPQEAKTGTQSNQDFLEGFPVPHSTLHAMLKREVNPKRIRQLLRAQLLHCDWPKDVLRIVAVTLQDRRLAQQLSTAYEALMRAIYRCRNNVTDPRIFGVMISIICRLRQSDVPVHSRLILMALKFAARSRSLPAMKRVLKLIRREGITVTGSSFRAVIAKCSIGSRGLGEIRNGRWKQRELLQVLKGFDDTKHLPMGEQYHLGTFVNRNDWQFLHGWIAVLARCKDSDAVWREWEFWYESDARRNPRPLQPHPTRKVQQVMNTGDRGDMWFVEEMAYSGDYERTWRMLESSTIEFSDLKDWVKDKLLGSTEYTTLSREQLQAELREKLKRDEVRVKTDWEDLDYGFPYEDPEIDRPLHDPTAGTTGPDV